MSSCRLEPGLPATTAIEWQTDPGAPPLPWTWPGTLGNAPAIAHVGIYFTDTRGRWFAERVGEPSSAQRRGWDAIRSGAHSRAAESASLISNSLEASSYQCGRFPGSTCPT